MRSDDSGKTWTDPLMVNPDVAGDKHHVLPALAIAHNPNEVHVTYHTQHSNNTIDLDMANSGDRGGSFPPDRTACVTGTSFDLPPTNIPIFTASNPFAAPTTIDRQPSAMRSASIRVTTANGSADASWGDMLNLLTKPVNPLDPIFGQMHSQEDVFVLKLTAQ